MKQRKDDLALVWDMLHAARSALVFAKGQSLRDFETDDYFRSAVERKVEIIGEAARAVSRDFQTAHPSIPWAKIIAQRHVLAHEYDEIIFERLWRVVTAYLPELIGQLEKILPEKYDI